MNPRRPVFYFDTLTALMTRPSRFFATRFQEVTAVQSLIVLTISSVFFAATGSLLKPESASLTAGMILFANAVGMAILGSAACYLAIATTAPRRYAFGQLFSIFSLSSGAVLLIAWVPSAFFITEPWKWWLIGTGMVNGLGMSKTRAAITMLFTFAAMVLLVYALLPMVAHGPVQPA
ncbi:hypothetical protein [uncultured Desulfosarcina sp.]|uniref:hypothetical protein n=1 Tax=uncultured Desulfosarcina sp. TaxID=218289 RepID=UPI0029C674AC|nr:hypothetical protein [uncultured Desulfosarcina sp.]